MNERIQELAEQANKQEFCFDMNEPKPFSLELADMCEAYQDPMLLAAAGELRRLYQEVQRLEAKLDDIYYQNSMNA
jgi:hypothetical protein